MAEKPNIKKSIIQVLILIVLIVVSFFIIFKLSGDFSFAKWFQFVSELSTPMLVTAFVLMLCNIFFKGCALNSVSRSVGYPRRLTQGLAYSSADLYFSAITPSATGGQPACLYLMVKDGMPISVATAVISFNLMMYTATLVILGIAALIIFPTAFFQFNVGSKILIIFGFAVQVILLSIYIMILISERVVLALGRFMVNILCALKIFKNKENANKRLEESVHRFKKQIQFITEHKSVILKSFIFNMGERIAYVAIGVCIFYGHAGLVAQNQCSVLQIFALESFALLAAYSIPLPGAVGGAEAAFLWIFSIAIPGNVSALNATMFTTRGIEFYIMFIVAGIITLAYHLATNVFGKNRNKAAATAISELSKDDSESS